MVVYLDSSNRIISSEVLFRGTVNSAHVYPREIMKEALLKGAVSLILVHNHPSQNYMPSLEDRTITKQIIEAAKLVDINILDHLIVTGQQCYSVIYERILFINEKNWTKNDKI